MDIELLEDVLNVISGGVHADRQLRGNRPCNVSFGQERLQLTFRQREIILSALPRANGARIASEFAARPCGSAHDIDEPATFRLLRDVSKR